MKQEYNHLLIKKRNLKNMTECDNLYEISCEDNNTATGFIPVLLFSLSARLCQCFVFISVPLTLYDLRSFESR